MMYTICVMYIHLATPLAYSIRERLTTAVALVQTTRSGMPVAGLADHFMLTRTISTMDEWNRSDADLAGVH